MSQVIILILYVIWVAAAGERLPRGPVDWLRVAVFFAGFAFIVLIPAFVARFKTRHAFPADAWMLQLRFGRLFAVCRLAIPIWFAIGVLAFSVWPSAVGQMFGRLADQPFVVPGMLFGPLPALLAWIGLWWAQYPIEQLTREQSVLPLLEANLPVHAPPTLGSFLASTLRLQVLATVVPLLMIGLLRDAGAAVLLATGWANPRGAGTSTLITVASAILVLLIAPEALRRILRTQRLPANPLRDRLDALCSMARTRYREVLLWRTNYGLGNAAVMGVLPQIRYVLLSDLLLETMDDREIEAVFAHELGHIVHRHTMWYVVFLFALILIVGLAEAAVAGAVGYFELSSVPRSAIETAMFILTLGGGIILFGCFSRRLERQADVYAARAMQQAISNPAGGDPRRTPVAAEGAQALASALFRAAAVNHIPAESRSFRHGSIASRVNFLRHLAGNSSRTARFDRSMTALYAALLASLLSGAAVLAWMITHGRASL